MLAGLVEVSHDRALRPTYFLLCSSSRGTWSLVLLLHVHDIAHISLQSVINELGCPPVFTGQYRLARSRVILYLPLS